MIQQKMYKKYKATESHLLPWRYREVMKKKCSDQVDSDDLDDWACGEQKSPTGTL